jgi:hypothetical protein
MIEGVLRDYVGRILPRLWKRGYHLKLAKGGINYPHLSEQTMLAHVLNGAFGFSRLWAYLDREGVLPYDEAQHRQFLSLWTTHDLYKLVSERLGSSTFSLSEQTIKEEIAALGLQEFAETTWRQHRIAMVGDPSPYHGDLALCPPGTQQVLDMVHVADALASITSPRETSGVWSDLLKLSPKLEDYTLYWHELPDVRGVLTNQIHRATTEVLEQRYDLFPILFFATGVLYIGKKGVSDVDRTELCRKIADEVLSLLRPGGVDFDIAQARRKGNPFRFEPFVFTIVHWDEALRFGYAQALRKPSKKFWPDLREKKWFGKSRKKELPYSSAKDMQKALGMKAYLDNPDFNQRWNAATTYLDFADGIVEECVGLESPSDRVRWFACALDLPDHLAEELAPKADKFSALTGGKACGYTVPLAYHWLQGPDFADRPAIARDLGEVLDVLDAKIRRALADVDPSEVSKRVLQSLHVHDDLIVYLNERLTLSFALERVLEADPLPTYVQRKRQSHKNLCSLCSRASEWCQPIQTAILAESAQEFSNRLLPRPTTQERRPWCRVCYLEFTLRLLGGLAPPPNVDSGKSRRLYLYVLPTYSFTPESVEMFGGRMLRPFQEVTALQVRDYGADAPSHAHLWIGKQAFDEEMVEQVIGAFERQARWVAEHLRREGKELPGERLFTVRRDAVAQPNYLLFVWEKTAFATKQEDARIPTTSEMWAKAAFGAALLAALTGCKVYVTERPYLPTTDIGSLKPTVILDSPHNALRSVLTGRAGDEEANCPRVSASPDDSVAPLSASLPEVLDVMAALWQINSELKRKTDPRLPKDKSVATRLEELGANPLAGAFFYRQYARLNNDATPFPIYAKACSILLERKGGEMMNIAKELAEKSLTLFLPLRRSGRGKAHLYEVVLRDAMEAIRKAPSRCLEELKAFAAGTLLKALERRQQSSRSEGIVNPTRNNLNRLVEEFVTLLVDEVLVKRANGSVAAFNRLANQLADAVYFEIDRTLDERWKEWKEQQAKREEAKTVEGGAS